MTDQTASYYDANGCLITPEVPAVPSVPAYVRTTPVLGWNAGANSIDALDGDVYAKFTAPAGVTGLYMGLKGTRAKPTQPNLITHALYFERGIHDQFRVVEQGVAKTELATRNTDDWFEIRRVAGTVTYRHNGVLLYTSATPSTGAVLVNACLYASGDEAPGGNSAGQDALAPAAGAWGSTLQSGTTYAVATAADPDGNNEVAWWAFDVPAGSNQITVTVTDNANGGFAADGDAWIGLSHATPFSDAADSAWSETPGTLSYTYNFSAADADATWSVLLDSDAAITGLHLTVTVSTVGGGGA